MGIFEGISAPRMLQNNFSLVVNAYVAHNGNAAEFYSFSLACEIGAQLHFVGASKGCGTSMLGVWPGNTTAKYCPTPPSWPCTVTIKTFFGLPLLHSIDQSLFSMLCVPGRE